MAWKLKVLENNTEIRSFKFRSLDDARNFRSFARIYMDETGGANGYSAYWPSDNFTFWPGPRPCLPPIFLESNRMNVGFVRSMLYHILQVRFTTNHPNFEGFVWRLEHTRLGIKFQIEDLPPTTRPEVGDMYRIPRKYYDSDLKVLKYDEGRVVEDLGSRFKVIPSHLDGDKNREPKFFEIDACLVIKINDWKTML